MRAQNFANLLTDSNRRMQRQRRLLKNNRHATPTHAAKLHGIHSDDIRPVQQNLPGRNPSVPRQQPQQTRRQRAFPRPRLPQHRHNLTRPNPETHPIQRVPHAAAPLAIRDAKIPHRENLPQIRLLSCNHSMLGYTPLPHKLNVPPHTRTVSTLGRTLPLGTQRNQRTAAGNATQYSGKPIGHSLVQSILIEGHAYRGVHPYPFESHDFSLCLDAARGNDRRRSGAPHFVISFARRAVRIPPPTRTFIPNRFTASRHRLRASSLLSPFRMAASRSMTANWRAT